MMPPASMAIVVHSESDPELSPGCAVGDIQMVDVGDAEEFTVWFVVELAVTDVVLAVILPVDPTVGTAVGDTVRVGVVVGVGVAGA